MKKTLFSFMAVAAITTTVGVTTYAEEVTIKKGDTLSHFAQEYGVSIDALKDMNGLSNDKIYENETLNISSSGSSTNTLNYTVVAGDTLWSIGQKYNVSTSQLQSWNDIKTHLIYPNQQLIVSGNGVTAQTEAARSQVQETVVQETVVEEQPATVVEEQPAAQESTNVSGQTLTVTATAYTAHCEGCSGTTATGINLLENPDMKVIAVDPSVIPLGTEVYVEGYGNAVAGDTGGAIKGNKIDVFIPSHSEAMSWGRKTVNVTILD